MDICFPCIALIVGSSLIGLILGRLIFGGFKKDYLSLQEDSARDKSNIGRITHEYNEYKAKTTKKIQEKDKKLEKLSTQNNSLTRMASSSAATDPESKQKLDKWKKKSEELSKEVESLKSKAKEAKVSQSNSTVNSDSEYKVKLDKWKKKSEELSKEVESLKSEVKASRTITKADPIVESQVQDLKVQLANAVKKIRKQDMLLMEAKKESFPDKKAIQLAADKILKHKTKAKKYKAKFKELKALVKKQNRL